jgi:hypothetical protein
MAKRQTNGFARLLSVEAVLGIVTGAGLFGWLFMDAAVSLVGCNIKGNISVRGERIYHLPHHRYYGETHVNPLRGERFFCSEKDALLAGWRRARL